MTRAPFVVSIYDKNWAYQDTVTPLFQSGVTRDELASTWSFTLDSDDDQVGVVTAMGSHAVIEYFHDPLSNTPKFLLSGLVGERTGEGGAEGTRTFEVIDHWALVMALVGIQVPGAALTAQGDYEYVATGPAETVAKTVISANKAELGIPVTVATTAGLGSSIRVALRMVPIFDKLYPAVTQAGVSITVGKSGAGLLVAAHAHVTRTETLTEASGVVVGGKWSSTPPSVTSVIVQGGGVGTARLYRRVTDAAAETSLGGLRLARAIDARDTSDTAVMDQRGQALLTEGAAKASVSCELAETEDFRYGITANLSDIVPIQLAGAPLITGRISEVAFSHTKEDGLIVTPRIGEVATTFQSQASAAIRAVAARQRNQDARS